MYAVCCILTGGLPIVHPLVAGRHAAPVRALQGVPFPHLTRRAVRAHGALLQQQVPTCKSLQIYLSHNLVVLFFLTAYSRLST